MLAVFSAERLTIRMQTKTASTHRHINTLVGTHSRHIHTHNARLGLWAVSPTSKPRACSLSRRPRLLPNCAGRYKRKETNRLAVSPALRLLANEEPPCRAPATAAATATALLPLPRDHSSQTRETWGTPIHRQCERSGSAQARGLGPRMRSHLLAHFTSRPPQRLQPAFGSARALRLSALSERSGMSCGLCVLWCGPTPTRPHLHPPYPATRHAHARRAMPTPTIYSHARHAHALAHALARARTRHAPTRAPTPTPPATHPHTHSHAHALLLFLVV